MIKQTMLNFKLGVTNDMITPRSGLAVFSEFLRGFGMKELIDKQMPLPGSNRGYEAWSFIEPLMLMLYSGGEHIEDLREIINDKALREVIGMEEIPSPSTYGDWLRRTGNGKGYVSFIQVIDNANKKALKMDKRDEYTLWSDPTLVESWKSAALMTYKGFKGYRPIITAFKELPIIVYHAFRDGNAMGGTVDALDAAYRVLPDGKRIKHASLDSEFYTAEVINFLVDKGTTFAIVADKNRAVMEAIRCIKSWRPFVLEDGSVTDREIGETVHTMEKTKDAFRLVVLRWRNKQADLFNSSEYFYHAIATDMGVSAEEVVWEYNSRGQMENYIKELKSGFGMERVPSGDFGANAMWFAIGVLTYNMFVLQKEHLLPKEYKTKTIGTLRWSLIEIAGKVLRNGRRLWLLLSTTVDKLNLYRQMRRRCMCFG